ncbi:MAG: ComEC/Rec2 family competence protein [Parachlamydiales bacterium]|nr:ComEC/Rec2 family competence protein [Parachlamydiales bacterium]
MYRDIKKFFLNKKQNFISFFLLHPLCGTGLFFFLGTSFYFYNIYWIAFVLSLIWLSPQQKIRFSILFCAGFFYCYFISSAKNIESTLPVQGKLSVTHISSTMYGNRYYGTITFYSPNTHQRTKADCYFYYRQNLQPRYQYRVQGCLIPHPRTSQLKITHCEKSQEMPTLSSWRILTKQKIRKYVFRHIHHIDGAHLLSALLTGNLENSLLRFSFNRIGQQHILAISGFHFSMIVIMVSCILRRFSSFPFTITVLLPLVTFFLLYIGPMPSVIRAWIMLALLYGGLLFRKISSPLNLWGGALIGSLLYDPEYVLHIGFQLSFASVLGIFLYFSLFEHLFSLIFPLKKTLTPSWKERIFFFFKNYYLLSFSLFFSVMILVFPLLLFHFHKIPFLSLLYALFFPSLITLLIFLWVFTCLIHLFIPSWIFCLCDHLSHFIVSLAHYPPILLDYSFRCSAPVSYFLLAYLFTALFIGIQNIMQHHHKKHLIHYFI